MEKTIGKIGFEVAKMTTDVETIKAGLRLEAEAELMEEFKEEYKTQMKKDFMTKNNLKPNNWNKFKKIMNKLAEGLKKEGESMLKISPTEEKLKRMLK